MHPHAPAQADGRCDQHPAAPCPARHTTLHCRSSHRPRARWAEHNCEISGSTAANRRRQLQNAREFPGYAFITLADGKLLVSHGEEPVITRYEITPELGWHQLDRVSFARLGVTGSRAGFESQWFGSESAAYVTLDVTLRVIWNPSSMLVDGVAEDSALELTRDGLMLDAAFNRQPRILGGPVLKPFYYRDEDWYRFGSTTAVAVYDPETHAERSIVEVPRPGLEVSSRDEAWTGGRPVMRFRYMRDGTAIGTVLHSDEVEVDYTAGYDDDVATERRGISSSGHSTYGASRRGRSLASIASTRGPSGPTSTAARSCLHPTRAGAVARRSSSTQRGKQPKSWTRRASRTTWGGCAERDGALTSRGWLPASASRRPGAIPASRDRHRPLPSRADESSPRQSLR